LDRACLDLPSRRPLMANFEAGRCESSFQASGFEKMNTLIWMNLSLDKLPAETRNQMRVLA
jgi:hypothetical protein